MATQTVTHHSWKDVAHKEVATGLTRPGIRQGDVIESVNLQAVKTIEDLRRRSSAPAIGRRCC